MRIGSEAGPCTGQLGDLDVAALVTDAPSSDSGKFEEPTNVARGAARGREELERLETLR